jgi:putative membrane protein
MNESATPSPEEIPQPLAVQFPARRQHPTGVFQYIVKYTWMFIRGFWPILAGAAVSDNIRAYGEWISLAVLVISCLSAVFQYWKFTFQITEDALVIRRGVLERERITIAFERIQVVNLEQSIWQRAFGVMSVKVDTAGTAGAEVEIAALKVEDAKALKVVLSSGRLQVESDHEGLDSMAHGEQLISLSWSRLFKIGLTQNHLRNALIAFGSIIALAEPLEGLMTGWLSNVPSYTWVVLKFLWVLMIPLIAIGVVVVGMLVSLIGAVLRYYNLQVRAQSEGLELSGGLFKKFEFKIPLHKVQMLEGSSSVLQRVVGFETFRIHQARAQTDDAQGAVSLAIPGLESDHANRLNAMLFPPFADESEVIRPHKLMLIRMLVFRAAVVVPVLIWGETWMQLAAFVWGIWLAVAGVNQYRGVELMTSEEQLCMRTGWLRQKHLRTELRKAQRVVLTESWLMRRRGLAHARVYTAAGPVVVRFIPKKTAIQLRDLVLYQAESTNRPWM